MAERGTAVLAYDVATGQRRWSAPVDADARGPVVPSEDAVLVLEASGVTALDAATGAPRWKAKTKEKAAQGNLLRTHGLVVAYTGSAGMTGDDGHKTPSYGHISAFDAATGTRRWDSTRRPCPC